MPAGIASLETGLYMASCCVMLYVAHMVIVQVQKANAGSLYTHPAWSTGHSIATNVAKSGSCFRALAVTIQLCIMWVCCLLQGLKGVIIVSLGHA